MAWWAWWTPGILTAVLLVGVLYAWVMWGPVREAIPGAERPTAKEAVLFYTALLGVYASLGSPLGIWAMDSSFAVHMLQHTIAGMAVPPLLIYGLPKWVWRAVLRRPHLGRLFRFLIRPIMAIVVFNSVFGVMVAPPIVTEMVRSMTAMIGWHIALMVTGVFMWWPLVSPIEEAPRLHPGLQILYLFLDGLAMFLPLAMVTVNETSVYTAAYGGAPVFLGMGLLAEQQLGGAICLTVVHVEYLVLGITRVRAWIHLEREKYPQPHLTVIRPAKAVPEEAVATGRRR